MLTALFKPASVYPASSRENGRNADSQPSVPASYASSEGNRQKAAAKATRAPLLGAACLLGAKTGRPVPHSREYRVAISQCINA